MTVGAGRLTGRRARRDAGLHLRHARKRLHGFPRSAVDLGSRERRLLAGELEVEGHLSSLHRQPIDETERHDVSAQVGIEDTAKGSQDGLSGESACLASSKEPHDASLYGTGQRGSSNAAAPRR
jgi:hypothetical protein